MCNVKRLDDFADKWPGSPWGPAHVVIEDANIDDENLDCAIRCIDALLTGQHDRLHDYERMFLEDVEESRDELTATLEFLRMLRAIPEDDRLEPGDSFCGEDPEPYKP